MHNYLHESLLLHLQLMFTYATHVWFTCVRFRVVADTHVRSHVIKFCAPAVDRFHFKTHVGNWCRTNVNPHNVPQLQGANMSICEQKFKHVARNKHWMR